MPLSLTNFTSGSLITSSGVIDRIASVEDFVNGGTDVNDFTTAWISTDLIVRPEFYSFPAPRMQGVSADVHHRQKAGNIEDSVVFLKIYLTSSFLCLGSLSRFICPNRLAFTSCATFKLLKLDRT